MSDLIPNHGQLFFPGLGHIQHMHVCTCMIQYKKCDTTRDIIIWSIDNYKQVHDIKSQ